MKKHMMQNMGKAALDWILNSDAYSGFFFQATG